MTALRSGARPLYSQLKETILDEIARGRLKPGDRLPSHRELGETHQMSHMTVRRAISELTNEGVISAVPGKGIYVAEPKEDADSGALISFHDDMVRRGMIGNTRTLNSYMTTPRRPCRKLWAWSQARRWFSAPAPARRRHAHRHRL